MGKNVKYVMSGGLVLSEQKDMKKLSKLAKEGWILESFENLCYKLRKGEVQDVEYCIDYNEDKNDFNEYLSMFENSEWEYVCSYETYHFFKAKPGTKPIYSDKNSLSLKYEKLYTSIKKSIIYMLVLVVLSIIGIEFAEKLIHSSVLLKTFKIGLYMITGAGIGMIIPLLICAVKAYKNIVKQ